ncbi:MAG: hypothetical protein MHM6MM_007315 [Cercozoa sp. M6MM]
MKFPPSKKRKGAPKVDFVSLNSHLKMQLSTDRLKNEDWKREDPSVGGRRIRNRQVTRVFELLDESQELNDRPLTFVSNTDVQTNAQWALITFENDKFSVAPVDVCTMQLRAERKDELDAEDVDALMNDPLLAAKRRVRRQMRRIKKVEKKLGGAEVSTTEETAEDVGDKGIDFDDEFDDDAPDDRIFEEFSASEKEESESGEEESEESEDEAEKEAKPSKAKAPAQKRSFRQLLRADEEGEFEEQSDVSDLDDIELEEESRPKKRPALALRQQPAQKKRMTVESVIADIVVELLSQQTMAPAPFAQQLSMRMAEHQLDFNTHKDTANVVIRRMTKGVQVGGAVHLKLKN